MKIYRIEHKDFGFGPLCGDGCEYHGKNWLLLFRNHSIVDGFDVFKKKHPYGVEEHHKFGMNTLSELMGICYNDTLTDLADYGFYLYEFEVDDSSVVCPDGQVVFDSRTAKRIRKI